MSADNITNSQKCEWNREALKTGVGALYTVEKTFSELRYGDWVSSYVSRNHFWQIEKINNESILAWEVVYTTDGKSYIVSGATKGNKRESTCGKPSHGLTPFKIQKVNHTYLKGPQITYTVLVWDRTTKAESNAPC